jgi:GT2 family glycosyltransferase
LSQYRLLFEEVFDRQGEEKDMCLRALNCGLSVCAVPGIEVLHAVSDAGRDWPKIRFYEHRNDVLRELLRCPTCILIQKVVRTWAAHTLYNLRHGALLTDLQVLAALPWIVVQAKRLRSPVSMRAYSSWVSLSSERQKRLCSSTVEETA